MLFATGILVAICFSRATASTVPFTRSDIGKRATCVVKGAQNAGTDDVPAISAALTSCGNGGIIQISAGVTYAIRSVLDFSACKSCDFQIEGTMKVSDDLDYWEGLRAIFYVNGVTGLTMR